MDTNICRFQLFCNFVTIPLIIEGDNFKKGMVNVGNSKLTANVVNFAAIP